LITPVFAVMARLIHAAWTVALVGAVLAACAECAAELRFAG